MDAIKINGLTKKYKDVVAVDNLSLSVHKGELFSLLGVNGAGKTTTIKMLSCLTQPTSGDAFLNGKSICKDTAAVKSLIAVSPQETAVAPGLSVRENLELMCGVHGFTKNKQNTKIAELTELLGLESVIKKKAGKLSYSCFLRRGAWRIRTAVDGFADRRLSHSSKAPCSCLRVQRYNNIIYPANFFSLFFIIL